MSDPGVAWLRDQVQARKTAAEAARHETDGHWWRTVYSEAWHERAGQPCGALYAGEPCYDADGDNIGSDHGVVYDEGRPSDEEFAHIALNDPRDVTARCEAELAILDLHKPRPLDRWRVCSACCQVEHFEFGADELSSTAWPCPTLRLLAGAYRHREGWEHHWGERAQA